MSLCRSLFSARSTAWLAEFLHVRVSMPAFLIKSSVDCFRVTTSLPLATLNSSTIEVNGSISWLVLPYSPILVKLGGTLSHLRRCWLITRSNSSTVDVTISYSIWGYKSMGNRPCWYNHALNLPGSHVLSISFKPSWSWFLVLLMLFVSFRLTSYHFPRHLIGQSIIDGISSPCTCRLKLLVTFPFLMTRLLDLFGLNFIRAQFTVSSKVVSTQRACTCVVVDMVRSSMNPLLDGRS